MLLAIGSEWECGSTHELFQNLLKASDDQSKAHHIIDSEPKDIFTEIDTDISNTDNTEWKQLLEAIKELVQMRKKVISTTLNAIRIITEGSITNDVDVLETVDTHLADFEHPDRLAKACSMVKLAQAFTDAYIQKTHVYYVQFTDGVVPRLDIIERALGRLINDVAGTETADWDIQMEATTQNIKSIVRQMETNMNERIEDFKDLIERMALDIDLMYQRINIGMKELIQNALVN